MSPKPRAQPAVSETTGNKAGGALALAGVAGLAVLGYHGTEFDVEQTTYASREECLADWGTEDSCTSTQRNQQTVYLGPRYYWDPTKGRPVIVGGDGSEHIAADARVGTRGSVSGRTTVVGSFARGGFGGIGHGFSSGRGG